MCGVEQGLQVWVRGCGLDLDMKLRYQGGADDWTVDCGCGTMTGRGWWPVMLAMCGNTQGATALRIMKLPIVCLHVVGAKVVGRSVDLVFHLQF